MPLNVGEIAGIAVSVGTLLLGIYAAKGKGRESAQTREDSLRQQLREADKTGNDCQDELAEKSRNLETMLDFLRDIVGDSYSIDWIRKRAAALLQRMNS